MAGEELHAIGLVWRALEPASHCDFFLTWGWIGPWAALMVPRTALYLLRCESEGRTVGLAFLTRQRVSRGRGLIRSTQLQLNQCDAPQCDMTIEFNGILCAHGCEAGCWEALALALREFGPSWDELACRSLSDVQLRSARVALPGVREEVERAVPTWTRSLGPEAADEEQLLAGFKKKTRQQLRQTLREFEEVGAIEVDLARTAEEALAFFAEMGSLHSARWARVGQAGSFANDLWTAFHRQVITECFGRGEVLLSRVSVAGEPVGFIYGFRWRDRFYALQTGFKPQERPALRSGFLTHFRTLQALAPTGIGTYDLLPDEESSYKRLLAEPEGLFTTVCFQRSRLRFVIHRLLRRLKRRWSRSA